MVKERWILKGDTGFYSILRPVSCEKFFLRVTVAIHHEVLRVSALPRPPKCRLTRDHGDRGHSTGSGMTWARSHLSDKNWQMQTGLVSAPRLHRPISSRLS